MLHLISCSSDWNDRFLGKGIKNIRVGPQTAPYPGIKVLR